MNQQEKTAWSQYDQELINRLKKEIINDLNTRKEWREQYYGDMDEEGLSYRGYAGRPYGPPPRLLRRNYRPYNACWLERQEYDYQRKMLQLRKDLQNELRVMQQMNQRAGHVQDPQVRRLVYELLEETAQQGMDIPDLMQSVNIRHSPTLGNSLLDRIVGPIKGIDRNSFLWGAGAALLGVALLPAISKTLRPFARKAVEEVMEITERTQGMFAQVKEEFEDIVAEASFNKLKNSVTEPTDQTPMDDLLK